MIMQKRHLMPLGYPSVRYTCCLYMLRKKKSSYLYLNWQVIEAGANALVAGSAVFGAKDYAEGMDPLNLYECERDIPFFTPQTSGF